MKYKFVLLIIVLPVFASAQTKTFIDSLASAKLNELKNSWTLGIKDNAGIDADIDIEVYNNFKKLFAPSASIEDDLDVFYHYNNVPLKYKAARPAGIYDVKAKHNFEPFDVYAHDIALQLASMRIDSVVILDSNTADTKNIWFSLRRSVHFEKPGKYVLPDNYAASVISSREIMFDPKSDSSKMNSVLDSAIKKNSDIMYAFTAEEVLRVTMAFDAETRTVSITGITTESNAISCKNDFDKDAVPNGERADSSAGDFTANGIPDYDFDGVADAEDKCPTTFGTAANKGCPVRYFYTRNEFDAYAGLQFNSAKINLPELNRLGYVDNANNEAMDVLQSQKGVLKNPGLIAGVNAGVNFTFYFGKRKKQSGISVGFNYARFTAEYSLVQPIVYTFKSFDGVDFYRRQITISSLKEEINYNVFNLPVLFNYRFHLDKKNRSVIKLQAGPSLMLFRNTSTYNAVIDFGGIYQIDTVQKNTVTYYDHFDNGSSYNVYLTSNNINGQNPGSGAENVFQQLKQNADSYDFASNKNYTGKQNLQRTAIALNAGIDLQQKISEGLTIKIGASFLYAPLPERKTKYKPIDKTSDEFQSIYFSTAKSNYSAAGINIGFVYNW